jgi:hypothetical protein
MVEPANGFAVPRMTKKYDGGNKPLNALFEKVSIGLHATFFDIRGTAQLFAGHKTTHLNLRSVSRNPPFKLRSVRQVCA